MVISHVVRFARHSIGVDGMVLNVRIFGTFRLCLPSERMTSRERVELTTAWGAFCGNTSDPYKTGISRTSPSQARNADLGPVPRSVCSSVSAF